MRVLLNSLKETKNQETRSMDFHYEYFWSPLGCSYSKCVQLSSGILPPFWLCCQWHRNPNQFFSSKLAAYNKMCFFNWFTVYYWFGRHWLLYSSVLWTWTSIWNENPGQCSTRSDSLITATQMLRVLLSLLSARDRSPGTARECAGILCSAVSWLLHLWKWLI